MRHRIRLKKLNRTSEHRRALCRNMAQSMIEHGQVTTTLAKAKNLKPYMERVITLAVKSRKLAGSDKAGSLRARRQLYRLLGDRSIIPAEHREDYFMLSDARRHKVLRMQSGRRYRTGEPKGRLEFTGQSVTYRVIEKIAPRFEERTGGYTRLIRLPARRIGDSSELAVLQFVGDEEAPTSLTKPARTSRKRKADSRYGMAVRVSKEWAKAGRQAAAAPAQPEAPSNKDAASGEDKS